MTIPRIDTLQPPGYSQGINYLGKNFEEAYSSYSHKCLKAMLHRLEL